VSAVALQRLRDMVKVTLLEP